MRATPRRVRDAEKVLERLGYRFDEKTSPDGVGGDGETRSSLRTGSPGDAVKRSGPASGGHSSPDAGLDDEDDEKGDDE